MPPASAGHHSPPPIVQRVLVGACAALLLCVLVATLGCATRKCVHGLRRATDAHRARAARLGVPSTGLAARVVDECDGERGGGGGGGGCGGCAPRLLRPLDAATTVPFGSGDIVFLMTVGRGSATRRSHRLLPPWAPRLAKQLVHQTVLHVGVVARHPLHGLVLLESCYHPKFAPGARLPPTSVLSHPRNLLRADGATLNGTVKAARLEDALTEMPRCAWARRAHPRLRFDDAAVWAAAAALNAAVPYALTLGGTYLPVAERSALLGRAVVWGARGVHDGLRHAADALIHRGGGKHLSCVHTALLLLEAGGAWPHVPHRLDGPSRGALHGAVDAARAAAVFADNAAALVPPPVAVGDPVAPIHAMPHDLSSDADGGSGVARYFWGPEVYVPSSVCPVEDL